MQAAWQYTVGTLVCTTLLYMSAKWQKLFSWAAGNSCMFYFHLHLPHLPSWQPRMVHIVEEWRAEGEKKGSILFYFPPYRCMGPRWVLQPRFSCWGGSVFYGAEGAFAGTDRCCWAGVTMVWAQIKTPNGGLPTLAHVVSIVLRNRFHVSV